MIRGRTEAISSIPTCGPVLHFIPSPSNPLSCSLFSCPYLFEKCPEMTLLFDTTQIKLNRKKWTCRNPGYKNTTQIVAYHFPCKFEKALKGLSYCNPDQILVWGFRAWWLQVETPSAAIWRISQHLPVSCNLRKCDYIQSHKRKIFLRSQDIIIGSWISKGLWR